MPHSAKKILHPLQSAIERESSALMSPSLAVLVQLDHLDNSLRSLRPIALDIFHLLGYVSLNTAALRKILKKYAKNVEPTKPQPGVAHTLPPAPQSLRRNSQCQIYLCICFKVAHTGLWDLSISDVRPLSLAVQAT